MHVVRSKRRDVVQNMMSNPEMVTMMETIGKKMMTSTPEMAQMMEAMSDPETQVRCMYTCSDCIFVVAWRVSD